MKTFRSKQAAPLPRRRVSLAMDGEEKLKAAFRRASEVSRLKVMVPQVNIPERIGKTRTSENDARIFTLAVDAASGINSGEFSRTCVSIAVKASARFFEVTAEAMRQVKISRADKLSSNKAHAIACLAAKLELEQRLDRLPDTLETTLRAYQIARVWFRNQPFAIHAPDERAAWSKARKAAGLSLPEAVRGKGK